MFNKFCHSVGIAACIAALVIQKESAQAQTSVNAKFETIQITKKCPDCLALEHWAYKREGFTETLKSPEWNTWVKIDWAAKTVTTTDGTTYPLDFSTNEKAQSQTYLYGGQKLTMYFNRKAEYIGHKVDSF